MRGLPQGERLLPAIGAALPLAGLTLLTVEDSRFASEAMRLFAQRSGARLRRAETMAQARRHLALYRPDVVIVDLGLPDGAGEGLIAEIAQGLTARPATTPPPGGPGWRARNGDACLLLATSGDLSRQAAALLAGAQGFIAKPVATLTEFQHSILRHWPATSRCQTGDASVRISPDPQALRDDLAHAADLLLRHGPERRDYVLAFLRGLARISNDPALERATRLADQTDAGADLLIRAIAERLSQQPAPFAAQPSSPD